MRKVKIITGSYADLSGKQLEQYNNEPEKKSTLPDGYTVFDFGGAGAVYNYRRIDKSGSGDIFADEYNRSPIKYQRVAIRICSQRKALLITVTA